MSKQFTRLLAVLACALLPLGASAALAGAANAAPITSHATPPVTYALYEGPTGTTSVPGAKIDPVTGVISSDPTTAVSGTVHYTVRVVGKDAVGAAGVEEFGLAVDGVGSTATVSYVAGSAVDNAAAQLTISPNAADTALTLASGSGFDIIGSLPVDFSLSGVFPGWHLFDSVLTGTSASDPELEAADQSGDVVFFTLRGLSAGAGGGLSINSDPAACITALSETLNLGLPNCITDDVIMNPPSIAADGTITETYGSNGNVTPPVTNDTVSISNPGSQNTQVSVFASLPIHASDSLSNALSFTASGLPTGLSINTTTGVVSGTPTALGASSVTVTATDGTASNSVTFTWTVSSVPPVGHHHPNITGPISSLFSAKCLDNSNFSWVAGNPIQQWSCGAAGGVDQRFELAWQGSNYELQAIDFAHPSDTTNWCVTSTGVTDTRLTIQVCTNAVGQQVAKAGSYYKFTGTAQVINLSGFSTLNGAHIISWPQLPGYTNEHWSLP